MTTTQITSFDYTIPVEYFGDFADDYAIDLINDEVCDAINDELPEGVALACNGMLFAEVEVADVARELDLREILEDLDIEAIIRRHEI
jgi:hypothetical protein